LLAEALAQKGELDEALVLIDEAVDQMERWGERHYEAETYRVRGDLLLARESTDPQTAELSYLKAIDVARRQEAKLFERRGKTTEAVQLLAPAYAQFTEGFNEVDLCEARATLSEIR
jgi:predicted ATPase